MKIKQCINSIKGHKIYFVFAIIIFIVDFISKYFVEKYMLDDPVKHIIGDLLIFIYTRNYGVAFGMLNNMPPVISTIVEFIIPIIVGIAIIVISIFICRLDIKKYRISLIAFTLILGGAIGNFIDRLMRGYVTDFINMGLNEKIRFPYNYNIADACITIGVGIMIIAMFVFKEDISKENNGEKNNVC